MMTRCLPRVVKILSNAVRGAFHESKGCLLTLLEMPVIPPKQASFTVVLSIVYYVGRHLHDP